MKRLIALMSTGVLVLAGCYVASADTTTKFEDSQITFSPNKGIDTAENAKRLKQETTGTITVATQEISSIKIRAKGVAYQGVWPNMRVSINGTVIADQSVDSGDFQEYLFPVNIPAGNNAISVAFTNEACGWWIFSYICNRALLIDWVEIVQGDTPTTTPTTTTTTPPAPVDPGSKYVALGDSYSSGWGAGDYDNSGCGRSGNAAAHGIAADLGYDLVFKACGGADTSHILSKSLAGEPKQIDAVTSDADLVTLTIGGNDSALMWMLEFCVKTGNCITADWFGAMFISQMNQKINATKDKVIQVLNAIIAKAPNAKILIAGYPYILPAPGQPRDRCTKWLTAKEQDMFADATIRTNNKIKEAVLEIGNPKVKFMDPIPFFPLGKDGCSSASDKYMIGTEIALSNGGWHPNAIGQDLYRQLYESGL